MLNKKNLNLVGWLSIVSAVLTIPLLIIGVISEMSGDKSIVLLCLRTLLDAGYIVLFVYIFIMFKRLLHEKAAFHDVDIYITLLIWINIAVTAISIAVTAISVAVLPFTEVRGFFAIGMIGLMIPLGILLVVFGIKLLKCDDDLFGCLKPFSYLTMATGIMTALVVCLPFSMITSIISDVILAIMFFKAAKLVQTQVSFASEQA